MNPAITTSPESELPSVVVRYFDSFNREDFAVTSSLFAENGSLRPPFDAPVVGREAIASYLNAEAKGMKIHPLHCTSIDLEDGNSEYTVAGKADTPFFTVNICWLFIINPRSEIVFTRVKLLASLAELLSFKNVSEKSPEKV